MKDGAERKKKEVKLILTKKNPMTNLLEIQG